MYSSRGGKEVDSVSAGMVFQESPLVDRNSSSNCVSKTKATRGGYSASVVTEPANPSERT